MNFKQAKEEAERLLALISDTPEKGSFDVTFKHEEVSDLDFNSKGTKFGVDVKQVGEAWVINIRKIWSNDVFGIN